MFKQLKKLFSTDKKLAKRHPKVLQYEELEPRVLFSADYMPGLDNIAVDQQVVFQDIGGNYQVEREAAPETVEQKAAEERLELVIVSEDVADYKHLIDDLQAGDDNRVIEVVVLESDRDGIEQVSEILAERSDVAAVHFITHGADGQINLGDTWLDSTTLAENSDAVAGWGKSLTETGDILFYGCNIAVDGDGQTLLDNIANLTGADVAASDDPTGSSKQGGDWDLEFSTGAIDTDLAPSLVAQQEWTHQMALETVRDNFSSISYSNNNGSTSWSGPWVETDGQGGGASGGNILVSSSCLYLHAEEIGDGIYRQANLAGAGTATLTFDIQNGLGVDDVIRLEISGNGGGSWNMLKDYSSANSGLPLSESFDISLYAAADTQIRFRYLVANGDDNPVLVDNIQIEYGDAPNTAPVNTVPGVQNTPVDTALEFSSTNGNAISINDIDAGSNPVEVTLTATNGTLTLDWPTGGTAITDGGETAANSTTTGSQVYDTDSPQTVAVADDGSYVVVWSGNGLGDADGVFFQRFDASGTAVGNETLVNVVTTGAQTAPAIGMDGDGNFVVVWQSDDGDGQGIFARCFDSSGSELSGEITVNSDPAEEQEEPSIAVARDGSFVVAWTDEETQGTKQDVFARIFDSSGTAQGLQFQVNGHTSLNQYHVAVAIDDAGNFVIAWGGVSATDNDGISARGFDASGAETIAEFQVNSTTTSAQFRPSVGMDAAGNFVVAWMGFEQPDPAPSVIARGFDANGTETMAEFPVTETTVNSQQQPAIAMDADGDFVIVWTADGQDGDAVGAWNTYARQFTANGSPKTGETLVNSTTTAGDQLGASVGMNDHGDFVVTWTGSGIGDTDGVFSQRYTVPTGLAYTSGSGINDTTMTFTGTITDINEALDGLTFTPDNGFIGMAGVQIDVNDLGYTGDGGALQDTDTVDITVGNPNTDSDGDGLWDNEEDANTDLDSDPSTNPGPDTDGDTFANYLDADDDGDGTPTSLENADPNSDGDPRDAVDSDHDGQPDYLDAPTGASDGTVVTEQKISDTTGGLTATLDDDDRFGTSVASIGDLDGDGINDIVVGAQYDDDGGTNRGAVHVLFLNADGTVKAEQKISDVTGGLTTTLDDSDIFGVSVALIGDLDSDGINDIAVGALNDDDGGTNRGAVHILFLNADGTVKAEQKISDTTGGLTATLDDSDGFGITVTGIGDLDGDGINDIAVGAFLDDDGGTDRGAVHVLFLNADGTVKAELKISDTTGGLTATLDDSDLFGVAVAGIGDLDGDGVNDLAVGAEWDDDGGADRGAVHILFLNADGTVKAELKISDTTGGLTATLDNEDYFGNDIAGIGDLNGDGINDIAVSAMFDDDGGTDRGAVHLLFLNADGTVKAEQKISDTAGGLTAALDNTDRFGISVAGIGDLDGDGAIDIAVGAQLDDDGGADRGAVYVLNLAAVNTAPTLSSLDGSPTFVEDGAAVVLDGNVDASDGELDLLNSSQGNYAGASLTLVRNGGASAEDVFVFNDGNGITLSGGNLIKNAQIIASFDIATTPGELVVSFTDAGGEIPTSADLDNILRQIAYANSNDTPPASVQIDWTFDDGNAGAQGTGGALTATGSTTATITAVNDAPVLDISGSMTLTTITEDETNNSGDLVSAIIASAGGDRITDADAGAVEGIAILGFSSGNGMWQYDIGSGWTAVGSVSDTSSLLLRATDSLRFVPDGLNADTAFVTFAAWDQTSGTAGTKVDTSSYGGTTPFSATVESPTITVTAINDDPTTVGIADVTVDEDAADSVVDLFAAFADVEDLDSALTYTITNNTNPGLFTATTIDGGAGSLTLDYTADQNGAADITVRATDTGGQFVETTFTVTVNAVNDAPLLSGANNLTAIDEDPLSNNGTLVSELISGQATDPDADALSGIAVIGVDNTNGTWQYTTNGGGIWTAFGSPSTAAARLLAADANTYVRFVPNADWNGTVTNGITFHAWDQTSGTSGSPADLTSVYTLLDQFSVVSYSNNDGTASWTSDWIEANDDGVASTSNIRIENNKLHVDNLDGGTFSSITRAADLTAATTATLTLDYDGIREGVVGGDRFTVEISDDGGGTWTLLEEITVPGATTANLPFSGSLSYTLESAVTLTNNMVIRLSISAGFGGTDQHVNFDNVQIQYTVIDQIGGSTAFSTVTASSSITVNPVNDAPTAANSTVTTDEDTTYTFSAGDFNFSDIDGDTLASVKITSLEAAGNLQLSGGDVTLNQVITRADIDADNLKFIPVADANGAGYDSFGFSVNDGTVDSAASYTMTINVTAVNDAPILLTDSVNNLTVLEDSGFTSLDLSGVTYGPGGGSDESTQTLTYEVTTIPDPNSFGKIYLADGTTQVTTGFYTLAEIQGMQFKPEPNENGGPSFFSYRVQDSGGTANGGNDILVESIQLDITPVADAPIITSDGGGATATLNIDENLTTVTTVTSTDSDGDTPLYSISAGVDAARFSINSSTGVLTFNSAPDFEAPVDSDPDNVYEVTVQVADGYGGFDTQEISVSVTNINDNTPVITSNGGGPNASISIAENTSGPIANVDATDADGGSLTYSISGGDDAAHFSIDAATGILSFVAAKDYEAPTDVGSNNSYNVNVTASDGTFSDTQAITVNVTDGNDAPVLDNSGDMTLTTILENHTNNPGDLIANVITSAGGDRITDQDSGAVEGIAVISVDDTFGTWQYSTDGGSVWIDFGNVSDLNAVVLSASDRIRFSPALNASGLSAISFRAWDGSDSKNSGTTAVNTTSNGGSTPFSSNFESASIEITPIDVKMIFTTNKDVINSGAPNLQDWTSGTILGLSDPNLQFEDGAAGTLSSGSITALVNFDDFAADNDVDIRSMNYVSSNLTVGGGGNTINLVQGDILFTTSSDETLTSTNMLAFTKGDVIVYRPDAANDYSSGTFIHLLDNPSSAQVTGLTLVEVDITVGDRLLRAGEFLFTENSAAGNNIYHFTADAVGAGTTSGTVSILIDGNNIGMGDTDNPISGVMLIADDLPLSGHYVTKGSLITSLTGGDASVGDNSIDTSKDDFFYLTVNTTGEGTTSADATLLFEGADMNMDKDSEKFRSITFIVDSLSSNRDPKITSTGSSVNYTENDPATIIDNTLTVSDVDSANFDGGILSIDFNGTGTLNDRLTIENQGFAAGQVGIIGSQVFYSNILVGNFSGGTDGTLPLTINLNASATAPAVQSVFRAIAYENVSDNPDITARTVRLAMTDGDGGTSNTSTTAINITSVNDEPSGTDNTVTTLEDTAYTFTAADFNFSDVEGDTLVSVKITSLEAVGSLQLSGGDVTLNQVITRADIDAGNLTFTPVTDANGVGYDSFQFTVNDGTVDSAASYTMTIDVSAVNDAPVAVDDAITATEDTPFSSTVDLDFNDTDIDGDALSVVPGTFATAQGGSLVLAADGSYTYTPAADFTGTDSVDYTVTDGSLTDVGTLTITVTAVNDAPVAVDDAITATEDTPFSSTVDLDFNDTDIDGDALSVVPGTFATAQGGSLVLAADGSYTYTPAADFTGTDSVDYTVTDGSLTDVGTLTITVTAVNDAPVAVDDAITATEDTPFSSTVDLDFNDTDIDGDALSVVPGTFATAQGGSLVLAADGSYTYTPAADFTGTDSVDYTVTDGSLTDVGTLTITVTAVNDAPVAVDDAITATEDTPFSSTVDLDFNDTDIDGDALSVVPGTFATAQGGSLVLAADGSYTYTPAADFTGTDSVDYTVTDGSLTDVGTLTITVTAVNDAPVAVDDAITATEDTPFSSTVDLDFNDTDIDGDALSVVPGTFATAQGGSLVLAADGSYTYTPAADFTGTDSVDYTVTDGSLTDVGTLTITVTAVNDAPVAVDDAITATEDTPFSSTVDLDFNDTDIDGDALSVVPGTFATAQGGSLVLAADGSYTYTPAADFTGTDSVDYTVTDGSLTDVGTLTITVTAVNDAPVAVDDAITATEDTPFSSTVDLDFNDTDIDGDALSVVPGTFATAQGGSLVLAADGSYTYTPAADFTGTDSVDYTVTDGSLTDVGTLTITVTAVNDAPVAVDDAITATEDTPFSSTVDLDFNDTDIDGDALSVVPGTFATAQGGSLVLAADGSYTYTPAADFTGTDSVDYTVTDGSLTDVGTLTITVTAVNDAPVAVDDAITATEDTPFSSTVDLDFNDTDIDGDALSVVPGTFATAQGGSLVLAADGSYTYTPAADFTGTDSVDYTVTDGSLTDVGTLTITVTAVNDAPVAVDDAITATEDTPFSSTVDLDFNDTDIDGDALSVVPGTFATAQGGSLVLAADGSYTYTPAADFTGTDSVDYTVTDGSLTDVGTLTITVTAVNDAPVAVDDAITATEDTPFSSTVDLDFNDTDIDGDALSVVPGTFATAQGGSLVLAADGSYTYTPAADFTGTDSVDYTVTDGSLTDVGTLTITVTAVNDAPVAVDDAITATEDTPFSSTVDLDFNDTDIDGDALSVVPGTFATAQGGSLVLAADGSYTYTPAADFTGTDSVDYTVTDGSLTDVGTLTITVTAVNDAPVAVDDAITATEDTPFSSTVDLDFNDTDIDGDALSVVPGTFATAQGGSLVLAADGSYTYTPAADFTGTDSVDYTVTDGSLTDVGTLTITVTAVNDAPVAVDDAITATEDTPFSSTVDLDFNDTDIDGDALSVVPGTFATAQGGSLVLAADGSYTYTPAADFTGTDSVDYTVTDGSLTDVGTLTITVTAVNDAPVAVDDAITATEDTPFSSTVDLDFNDTDIDGDALSVVPGTFATAQGGSLVLAADGSYTYTPAADFTGTDSVDYTVTDGSLTDVGTLTITVTAVNDAPVAVDDAITATEDTPFSSTVDLDFNDTDIDGDALSVVPGTFATAQGGSLVLAADGSYTYTPAADFTGTDSVDYTVTDGSLTDVGTLTITVTAVNDAPVAVDDAITATEDTPFSSTVDLDFNDTDIDGDALSVVPGTFATAQGGSLVLAADGSYTYTPAADFTGTDSVDYTVTDGSLTDVGTLTITVTAVNDAPVAVDDAITATEDTPFSSTVDLDFNDTDIDGDALSVVPGTFATAQGGSLVLAADGSYTYTPAADFTGTDSVDYTVTDGSLTDVGTLTITVTAVNDAPVAVDDAITATEDTPFSSTVDLDFNDTDIDGDALSVVPGTFATAQGGSLVLAADGSYTYTPAADFTGTDSVDYTVTDGSLTDVGTLTITVTAVNDAPVAVDDAITATEDTPFSSTVDLDFNDTDIDGDALSVVPGTFATAQGGSLVLAADGSYTYTPAADFTGTDSVDYTVTDGSLTDVGTLTITVTAVNDAPVAVDDAITATEDTPFSSTVDLDFNDTDIDGDALSVVPGTFATAQGGSLVLAADGSYTYTPAADFTGTDSVDYTVTDGSLTDVGTLTITVTAVNDAPVAVDDAITATEDTPFSSTVDLDFNDTDIDGDALSVVPGTFATAQGGSLVLAADGSYTYTPAADFTGTDSVDYTVTDGSLTDVGTLTITVTAVNDAPVAVDDAITATEDTPFSSTVDLDFNDTDIDGDALSVVPGTFATAQGGSLVLAADGSYTYTPAADFTGTDSVDYTVTDGSLTDVGTLTITVTAVNDAPVAVDDAITATEDTPFSSTVDLDFNDTDIDGDALSVVPGTFATAQGGSLVLAADGSYTYTPAADFTGTDSVDYTVTDGSLTDVGTLTITVTAVNDAPVAVDDAITATEDTPFSSTVDLDFNDTDIDGDALSVVPGTFATAQGGSLVLAADGSYTYTPAADFTGTDSVDYTVTDGSLTDVGTLTITVTAVNDAPVAVDDAITATEDTPFSSTVDLDFNDTDIDGDALSVVPGTFATAQGGSLVLAADGSYTYTPAADFTGTDSVDYTVTDGSLTDVGTLTITVTAVNDAPVAVDDAITATEDTPFSSTVDLDFNDTDIDGDALSVVPGTFATAQGGSLVLAADGSYTYTPAADFTGTDSVDYTVTDGSLTDVGTLTITVTAVNDAPVAVDDAITATEDTPFSSTVDLDFNDTDIDGDALSVVPGTFATAQGGSLVLAADGSYTYTPAADFTGTDSVDYTVTDGSLTDVGTLTITVTAVNDAPVAVDDAITATEDTPFSSTVDLDFNDTDIDGDALSVVPGTFATAQGGSLVLAADGSYTYTPAADFTGTDSVDYTVTDGSLTDVGTLTITVTAVNDAPVAVDDAITATEDTPFNATLPAATDADGDAITYALETTATNGTAVVNADGSFSYTPDLNSNAADSFTYTVSDGNGASNTYTVSINVTAVNDAPNVLSNAVTAATENAAYSYTITTSDVDGDALTITAPALPAWLTLVDNGDGTATLSGTPTNADVGDHIVELQIFDGALIDIQDFTVTVSGATTDDGDSDLKGSTNPDPEAFENPESDNEQGPGVELPTPEDQPQDPVIEDEPAPPVEESLTSQAAADGDAQLVPMQDPEIEENEEIIDLTDEIDPDSLAENHGYDSSYTFFENDLYKEIHPSDYLALDYTAFDGPIPIIEEGFSILDLDGDDANLVDLNENYDLHRQEIDESFNTEQKSQGMRANIVSITAASFAAGVVSYLLRAGSLVANLMSTLPLWRGFDPIVIFSGDKKKKKEKDRKDIPKTKEAESETLFDDKVE